MSNILKKTPCSPQKKNALFYPRSLFLLQFLPTPWVLRTKKFNLRLANTIRPSLASHQKFHLAGGFFNQTHLKHMR